MTSRAGESGERRALVRRPPRIKIGALGAFRNMLEGKGCREFDGLNDVGKVITSPECAGIIFNDGRFTLVVHSTSRRMAEAIMAEGMEVPARRDEPSLPDLRRHTIMLAGPDDRRQRGLNVAALAYRHENAQKSAKLVLAFPVANPGTCRLSDPFEGTALSGANGDSIVAEGEGFVVPGRFAVGYMDLSANDFVHNPGLDSEIRAALFPAATA